MCLIYSTRKYAFCLINFDEPFWLQVLGIVGSLQICRVYFPCSYLGLNVPIAWEALLMLEFWWDQVGPEGEEEGIKNSSS